jgi:3-deoxy-7-phosphoheptulonate synthase
MQGVTVGRSAPARLARGERRLLAPAAMRRALPAAREAGASVRAARESLRALLHGRDRGRLLVIVGPGSLHDPEGALDYARRLGRLAETLAGELVVVMRCFVDRPRSAGGWQGLVRDPERDGSCDLGLGLATARQLLRRIAELSLPCATELQEPFTGPYLEDLVAWGAVGACTSNSPVHRQLASAAPFPVGFETGSGGGLDAALRAMRAAGAPQSFPALGDDGACVVRATAGNLDRHLVLRRRSCDAGAIAAACGRAADQGVARAVLYDCARGGSGGDPRDQSLACRAALAALRAGAPGLLGVMLRSYLEEGRQDAPPGRRLRYGVSIDGACIGWQETGDLLCEIAEAVKLSR